MRKLLNLKEPETSVGSRSRKEGDMPGSSKSGLCF